MKSASNLRKKMRLFFSCKYRKFRVRENHKIKHNQTQWHNVNDFDFYFVPKCLHISNSRTKPIGVKMARVRNKESKTCIQKFKSFLLFCCLLIPFRYLQCMLFLSILLSIANTYSFCKFNAHMLLC